MSAFKRNLVPLLCIAFVAAAASTGIFYRLLGSRLRDASSTVPRQSLVVASHNLERGTVVKAGDLKVSTWSGAEPFTGGYTLISQVIGKTVYDAVVENEPITQTRVAAPDSSEGLAIATGMRAVSVRASDSSGVLHLLRPGYKVDVQVVGPLHGTELMLRTTLQNLEGAGDRFAGPVGRTPRRPGGYFTGDAVGRGPTRAGGFRGPSAPVAAQSTRSERRRASLAEHGRRVFGHTRLAGVRSTPARPREHKRAAGWSGEARRGASGTNPTAGTGRRCLTGGFGRTGRKVALAGAKRSAAGGILATRTRSRQNFSRPREEPAD